jgi:hypothetical protein
MVTEEMRIPSLKRGSPPCKDCGERHTACHARCSQYQAWKADLDKIKEAKRLYEEDSYRKYEEEKRRKSWGRKTF